MPRARVFAAGDPGPFVAIYGPSGSGKSTLARQLGKRLGLPVVELDAVYHQAGWQELDDETFRSRVRGLMEAHRGGWVIDGNYGPVRDLVLARATTAVWLRLPFWTVYPRLVLRTVRRVVTGEELWNGNREELRMLASRESMLLWGLTNWRPHRRKMREALRAAPPGLRIMVLRDAGEVGAWLASVRPCALRRGPSAG